MRSIKVSGNSNRTTFDCPLCGATSICILHYMSTQNFSIPTDTYFFLCQACEKGSIWKKTKTNHEGYRSFRLIDPIKPEYPEPSDDMPNDVAKDYEEARLISTYSPRSAAALLRLSLQKLCRHLGEPGDHIDTDIRSLARRPEFGERLIKAADTLRITGNSAVHPGKMDEKDIDNICGGLFDLINLIVRAGITQPKEWDAMYDSLPEGPRKAAEQKDQAS